MSNLREKSWQEIPDKVTYTFIGMTMCKTF